MKLLELLVKERIEWHPEALCYTQDGYDMRVYPCKTEKPRLEGEMWYSKGTISRYINMSELADDWQTAIVTKEQYDNACKLVDDGYTLWFGGECPVQSDSIVSVARIHNDQCGKFENMIASDLNWTKPDAVLGYKVIGEKPASIEIIRKPFDCRCGSVPIVTEYPAHSFLEKGVQHMKDRATQRDSAEGERSMAACVSAFNAMFGKDLTETQGWQFMVLLKMARSRNKFNPDDYEDGAAYTGLAGEAHSYE